MKERNQQASKGGWQLLWPLIVTVGQVVSGWRAEQNYRSLPQVLPASRYDQARDSTYPGRSGSDTRNTASVETRRGAYPQCSSLWASRQARLIERLCKAGESNPSRTLSTGNCSDGHPPPLYTQANARSSWANILSAANNLHRFRRCRAG